MFVKLTAAETERVNDLTERAKVFEIAVTETYKEAGMNLMVRWSKPFSEGQGHVAEVLNITRFADMIETAERAEALKVYLANGGTVKSFDADVAGGLAKSKYVARKNSSGGRKAEPISTGDKKFDMYLNALPEPVRVLVVPLGLDPRALYKEYRALKKDGLIAKYATEENVARAKEVA